MGIEQIRSEEIFKEQASRLLDVQDKLAEYCATGCEHYVSCRTTASACARAEALAQASAMALDHLPMNRHQLAVYTVKHD